MPEVPAADPVTIRVASPPATPLVIFDGDCGFCRFWVARWRGLLEGRADFEPYQTAAPRFPEIPVERFRQAVGLILPDGSCYSGAEAVFRALALRPGGGAPLALYRFRPLAAVAEGLYGAIAAHRDLAAAATRAVWGGNPEAATHRRSRRLFLGALGAISLVAFLSLWIQIDGLIGVRGIAPAGGLLAAARDALGTITAWRVFPTLFWLGAGNGALHAACATGAVLSILLALDAFPALCAFGCWALYLSLSAVGGEFLSFQWDALLIETLFVSIFAVDPRRLRGASEGAPPPSRVSVFLFRCLLFRLMFSSGVVKLASGDRSWRDLTALTFHYETQPLPTWIGWWAHQMPGPVQALSAVLLFAIEIAVPFFFFAPRRLRNGALLATALLQVLIGLTGNYAFFNLLALALCLFLVDDQTLGAGGAPPSRGPSGWPRPLLAAAAAAVLFLGTVRLVEVTFPRSRATAALASAVSAAEPFRTVNGYGLFAVMTTSRAEIVVEGSDDGAAWHPYAFRWKPGDVLRRPGFVEPHQPRLDWQMWFAALGDVRQSPWFVAFVHRLLEADPEVTRLLADDPFRGRAPRFVRAELWDYRFTDIAARRRTGAWWTRRRLGEYLPPVTLEDFSR